jgi:uncharacterized protein YndB with AHSA1/START domain
MQQRIHLGKTKDNFSLKFIAADPGGCAAPSPSMHLFHDKCRIRPFGFPKPPAVLIGLRRRDILGGVETGPVKDDKFKHRKQSAESHGSEIAKRVWIKASAEVVYKALTESRELVRWFCDRASCDPREGGELVAHWRTGASGQKGRAVITRLVACSALELLWIDDGCGTQSQSSSHTLRYEIRSKSGLTELVMTDRDDSTSDEETFAFLDQGWNSVLLELKDYCERKERSAKTRPHPKSSL